MLQRRVVSEAQ
jgi:hypothetical protein